MNKLVTEIVFYIALATCCSAFAGAIAGLLGFYIGKNIKKIAAKFVDEEEENG